MGFFEDTPAVMVEIFILALVCIIMFAAVSQVSGMFDTIVAAGITPDYTNEVGHSLTAQFPIMDQGILLVMVFMMLVTLILAWYIPSHPALLIGYIVLVVVLIFMAPIFTNVYSNIVNTDFFQPYANQFPIANTIMSNLPLIIIAFSAIVAVVSYGKPRSDQAGVLSGLG